MLPDWIVTDDVKRIFSLLDGKVRLVGGCVRDIVLGKDVQDIDAATVFLPEDVIRRLSAHDIKVIPTGLEHGTITAVVANHVIEITTLRRDVECYGRHAEVVFTDNWEEDAARRDFTINAMSCSLDGKIYDYYGGLQDLNTGCVRFVGDANERCKEDVLRILRFFRFYAFYGKGGIDKHGLDACERYVERLSILSGERVQKEMLTLLGADRLVEAFQAMYDIGALQALFGQEVDIAILSHMTDAEQELGVPPYALLRLAALLRSSGFGEDDVRNIAQSWRLSNKDKAVLLYLISEPLDVLDNISSDLEMKRLVRKWREKTKFFVLLRWSEVLKFTQDDIPPNVKTYKALLTLMHSWDVPQFPLSGKDLIVAGYVPGKRLGELLSGAEKWWEDNEYNPSKEELIDWVKRNG